MVLQRESAQEKQKWMRRAKRLRILMGLAGAGMCLLFLRLAHMQIGAQEVYLTAADRNRIDAFSTPAPRGSVYDRRMRPLAFDSPSQSLVFARGGPSPRAAAHRLAPVLGVAEETLLRRTAGTAGVHALIAAHVSARAVAFVREHQEELPGVTVIPDSVRRYPRGDLACHILGYINSIPAERMDEYVHRSGFPPSTKVGWSGVELSYDKDLRGSPGKIRVEVNADGVPVGPASIRPAVPGRTLVLTIDADYQRFVQDLLAKQVLSLRRSGHRNVTHAMAVALDPRTGEVLALASVPTYRPEWFVDGIPDRVYREQFSPAERNWATQSPVAPGSSVKPLTALFALSKGAVRPEAPQECSGELKLPRTSGPPIRCWARHGPLTLPLAIAESCDVYFYRASLLYGRWPPGPREGVSAWLSGRRIAVLRELEAMQRAFGLGSGTGIDLPSEETGYVNDGSGQVTDLPYTAIGQNEVFTPLELAALAGTIANDGVRMRPRTVLSVGGVPRRPERAEGPSPADLGVAPRHLRAVQKGMYLACNDPRGTAYSTFHSGPGIPYTVAGKTGTAETGVRGFDNAVFIGYAPFDRPRIAIAVVVPGGGHGADSTGPVARAMLDRFFGAKAGNHPQRVE